MFEEKAAACRRVRTALVLGVAQANAVTALGGHVTRVANGVPDRARRDSGLDRLVGGEPTHVAEHEIARDDATVGLAKLFFDGYAEFAQSHRSTLTVEGLTVQRNNKRPGGGRGVCEEGW